jgi:hypothetical protein
MITSQDSRRTLEEIREGEYIVGAKRDSRVPSVRSSIFSRPQRLSSLPPGVAPSLSQLPPSSEPGWASTPGFGNLLGIPESQDDPSASLLSVKSAPTPQAGGGSQSPVDGLGLTSAGLEPPPGLVGILKPSTASTVSLPEPHEDHSTTIRALWKAEYGRLVSMYGQAGVDRNISDLRGDQPAPREDASSPFLLEPLPQPGLEMRESLALPRSARNSRQDGTQEDNSDESSHQRLSFISSAGYASSYTTRASFADTDSVNTREDIRKMVDDMRSTYLKAIEAREPSLQAVKSLKKRKKKAKSTPGGTPRTSGAIPPSTPDAQERRSVSAPNPSPTLHNHKTTRNFSSPVGGINKLPAIEASPSREREPEIGLKRADSSTLGALMGEHKRSSIQKRRSKRNSRRLSGQPAGSPTHPRDKAIRNPSLKSEDAEITVLDEDFQNLYKDIFRTSTHDFWNTQPSLTPTLSHASISPPTNPPPPVPI